MTPTIVEGDLMDQRVAVIVNAWNRNVIPSASSVASSVEVAMALVEAHRFASVAFPVLGAGSGGLSEGEALEAMLATFARLDGDARVTVVKFRPTSR